MKTRYKNARVGQFFTVILVSLSLFLPYATLAQPKIHSSTIAAKVQEAQEKVINPPTVTQSNINLTPHSSYLVKLPATTEQIFVQDPKIADVHLNQGRELYIYGKSIGITEVVISTANGAQVYRYIVVVRNDINELTNLIKRIAPNSTVTATPLPEGILLEGTVANAQVAENIQMLAKNFAGSKGTIINHMVVKKHQQINLQVKVAEVQRKIVNQLGINWNTSIGIRNNFKFGVVTGRPPLSPGSVTTTSPFGSFNAPPDPGMLTGSIGATFIDSHNNLTALLDAMAQEKLATILAEPNLITRSGEEASFLAGGEFPYAVTQGTGANVTVTFQFKTYGVSLSFVPIYLGEVISLRIKVEVSELDFSQSSQDTQGNTIPALISRRAESVIEMGDGQSMVIAGLLSDQTGAMVDVLPGLGNIPILGALFRSTSFQNNKTELVIAVTPYLVEPASSAQNIEVPTSCIKIDSLINRIMKGSLEAAEPSAVALEQLEGDADFYYGGLTLE